jgi:phage gpG-like protein
VADENLGAEFIITVDTSVAEQKMLKVQRKLDTSVLLKAIGIAHLFWINENFRAQGLEEKWKPLARNTLANPRRGGGAQILRNTGRLAMSFTSFGVRLNGEDSVSVGTEVPYAKYHEFGGSREYEIRPVHAKVLAFWTTSGMTFRKVVRHPPLARRPLLPSKSKAEEIAKKAVDTYVEVQVKADAGD